jgi:amino acid efflux transporter
MEKQNNKAALKLTQVTALYVGSVLGSGILIIPGIVAEAAGPASLVAWGSMAVPTAHSAGLETNSRNLVPPSVASVTVSCE